MINEIAQSEEVFEKSLPTKRLQNFYRVSNHVERLTKELEDFNFLLQNSPDVDYRAISNISNHVRELDFQLLKVTSSIYTLHAVASEMLKDHSSSLRRHYNRQREVFLQNASFCFLERMRVYVTKYNLVDWEIQEFVTGKPLVYMERDAILYSEVPTSNMKKFLENQTKYFMIGHVVDDYCVQNSIFWNDILARFQAKDTDDVVDEID